MAWTLLAARRVAFGASAFALADVITGMAAYCVIILASLWFFSWSWLRLAAEAAANGTTFGTGAQIQWAWFGTLAPMPMIPVVLFLAAQAYRLPAGLVNEARRSAPRGWRAVLARSL